MAGAAYSEAAANVRHRHYSPDGTPLHTRPRNSQITC